MIPGGFKNMNADKIIQCILVVMLKLEKAVNSTIEAVQDKLDRGGYTGTAQDLDDEIQNLKNPDAVLKSVTPTITGLNISAPADSYAWRINQVVFGNTPVLAETLTPASDGFYRKDALLGTNTNTYLIIEGVEGDESVTPPTVFPLGTILLGVIDIFGNTVGGFSINDTSRTYVYGNGGATDYVEVTKLGTTLEIVNATSLTGFTIPAKNIQYGKDYYLRNSTGGVLTLKSATGTNGIRFYFPQGDLVVPVNNNVHLKYLINGEFGGLGYFTLVGIDYKNKADKTYVNEALDTKVDKVDGKSLISDDEITRLSTVTNQDISGKEDIINKGIASGYVPLDEFSKIAHQFLSIVNNLTTGGTTSLLSAEQGKVLQTQISAINTLLASDNVNLDTVQEFVDAIETVQMSLSTILVNDLTSGGITKALTAEMGKVLKGLIDALTLLTNQKLSLTGGNLTGNTGFGVPNPLAKIHSDGTVIHKNLTNAQGDAMFTKQVVAKTDGTFGVIDLPSADSWSSPISLAPFLAAGVTSPHASYRRKGNVIQLTLSLSGVTPLNTFITLPPELRHAGNFIYLTAQVSTKPRLLTFGGDGTIKTFDGSDIAWGEISLMAQYSV